MRTVIVNLLIIALGISGIACACPEIPADNNAPSHGQHDQHDGHSDHHPADESEGGDCCNPCNEMSSTRYSERLPAIVDWRSFDPEPDDSGGVIAASRSFPAPLAGPPPDRVRLDIRPLSSHSPVTLKDRMLK
jgi:hypothetical protein